MAQPLDHAFMISLPYAVHIPLSDKDQHFYIGFTEDLEQRFADHCAGRVPSTAPRRPLRLIHAEQYAAKSDALRREQYLKTTKGNRALRIMLRDALT
jgi:putative endonuclease